MDSYASLIDFTEAKDNEWFDTIFEPYKLVSHGNFYIHGGFF